MKLLFIDHACHKTTKSADFFVEILRGAFEVTPLYYETHYRTGAAAVARHEARWVEDRTKIAPFIASQSPCRPRLAARLKIALDYPLYLAEGARERLRHG